MNYPLDKNEFVSYKYKILRHPELVSGSFLKNEIPDQVRNDV